MTLTITPIGLDTSASRGHLGSGSPTGTEGAQSGELNLEVDVGYVYRFAEFPSYRRRSRPRASS